MLTAAAITAAIATGGLAFHYGRQARRLRAVLRQYAGPKISNLAPSDPGFTTGRRTAATIIFMDMQGFTAMSETLPPERVALLLREVFAPALDTIRDSGGEIDKLIGDAILARHSDPRAALDMAGKLEKTLADAAQKAAGHFGCPPPRFAAGLHTGEVFLCHLGTHGGYVDFTTIGDSVNLASRIQSLAGHYGHSTLISGDTYRAAGKPLTWRLLDVCRVKGRHDPVDLYVRPTAWEAWQDFEAARALYVAGDFRQAGELFRQQKAGIWEKRCRELQKRPPAVWNAIWKFSIK